MCTLALDSIIEKTLSTPILNPTHGTCISNLLYIICLYTFLPLGSNIPTRPSYRPPPATEPTDGISTLLLEEGQLSVPNIYKIEMNRAIHKLL